MWVISFTCEDLCADLAVELHVTKSNASTSELLLYLVMDVWSLLHFACRTTLWMEVCLSRALGRLSGLCLACSWYTAKNVTGSDFKKGKNISSTLRDGKGWKRSLKYKLQYVYVKQRADSPHEACSLLMSHFIFYEKIYILNEILDV